MPGQIARVGSPLEELLKNRDFRALIAEYIILDRLSVFLSEAIISYSNKADLLSRNERYCKNRLAKNISELSICKKKKISEDQIKHIISPVLNKLKLSEHGSSEWSMKYLAHFYSSHRFYDHLLYNNFFFELQKITHKTSSTVENPFNSAAKMKKLYRNSPKMMNKRTELLLRVGVPSEIIEFGNHQAMYYSIAMIALCFFLVDSMLKNVETTVPNWLQIVSSLLLFLTAGRALIYYSLRSPISLKEAGSAIRIGLNDQINKAITGGENVVSVKQKREKRVSQPASDNTRADDTYYETSSVAPQAEEKIPAKKIKTRPPFFSFFSCEPDAPVRIKLTWDNPEIPALEGIAEMKRGELEVDFLPAPGFSRAWSEKPNINIACKHDLFWQPESKMTNPVEPELARIISVGHVVRAKKQPGMVRIHEDPKFPDATYKAKSLAAEGKAKYRTGLFPVARSKQITLVESENNLQPELLSRLQDQVFTLHRAGTTKKTH